MFPTLLIIYRFYSFKTAALSIPQYMTKGEDNNTVASEDSRFEIIRKLQICSQTCLFYGMSALFRWAVIYCRIQ